jgi:hypothetical protein
MIFLLVMVITHSWLFIFFGLKLGGGVVGDVKLEMVL